MTEQVLVARRRINAAFLLGIVVLARPGCADLDGPSGPLTPGSWGGDRLLLEIDEAGGRAEFDCAAGTVQEPVRLNLGAFSAMGTYARQRDGLMPDAGSLQILPARYSGRVNGNYMNVTVTIPSEQRTIGSFTVRRGSRARVFKCL